LLALRLVRRTLVLKPDVVHCFKPRAYAGLAHFALWWLRRLGLLRNNLSPQTRLIVDEDDWEQAWNTSGSYSLLQKHFFGWQERWGLSRADAVVVASRALIGLVHQLGVSLGQIFYVPNGLHFPPVQQVDSDLSASEAAHIVRMLWELDNAPVVLLYTRFVEFRPGRVIEILRRIVSQSPRSKLLVVGEGLYGEESDLDDLLAAAGLSEHAVFTGWVEADRLPGYFAASDVAIFPYDNTLINRTKCSAKLTDLLAAGVPVVADDVGQNGEYIVDGETGLLVTPENDEEFADAVVHLLADPDLRTRLGTAAARRMQEYFAWDKLVEEVEKAYACAT
jgi:glycosyltransferase involved in cell wall biosynthesis